MSTISTKILYSREEIDAAINRLAEQITSDYKDRSPVIISILKGSFVFTADLIRQLNFPLEIEFVRLSSYGKGQESSRTIKVLEGLHFSIKDRDVLIVEDIIDTGRTTAFLINYLKKKRPSSIRLCALADKPLRREIPVKIDYLGFTVPNSFIVGYGIDWDEKFRYLPEICVLEDH